MTANVSFYLIAILTLRVKSHLLQRNARRCPGECARRRSPRQNISILYITRRVRKALKAAPDKRKSHMPC